MASNKFQMYSSLYLNITHTTNSFRFFIKTVKLELPFLTFTVFLFRIIVSFSSISDSLASVSSQLPVCLIFNGEGYLIGSIGWRGQEQNSLKTMERSNFLICLKFFPLL